MINAWQRTTLDRPATEPRAQARGVSSPSPKVARIRALIAAGKDPGPRTKADEDRLLDRVLGAIQTHAS